MAEREVIVVLALARAHQLHHVVDGIMIRKSESEITCRKMEARAQAGARTAKNCLKFQNNPDLPEDTPPRTFL